MTDTPTNETIPEIDPTNEAAAGEPNKLDVIPVTLDLNLDKVNYILSILAELPYQKSYMVIHDIQQQLAEKLKSFDPVKHATE